MSGLGEGSDMAATAVSDHGSSHAAGSHDTGVWS